MTITILKQTKKLIVILWSVFLGLTAHSQKESKAIDSLKNELAKNKLSKKVYVDDLYFLAKIYMAVNLDSAKHYASKSLSQAKKIDYLKGKAHALLINGFVSYYKFNNLNALKYYNKALSAYTKLGDYEGIIIVEINIANIESRQGNQLKAFTLYKNALEKMDSIDNKELKINTTSNLALVLINMQNYEEALIYAQKVAEIAGDVNNNKMLAVSYHQMALIYKKLNLFEDGITYYRKAISLLKSSENSYMYFYISIDLAGELIVYENYEEAKSILKAIFNNNQIKNYPDVESYAYQVQGKLQSSLKQYKLAEKSMLQAYKLIEQKAGKVSNKIELLINLGELYTNLNNFSKARQYLDKANKLSLSSNNKVFLSSSHLAYHNYYLKQQDFKKALNNFSTYKKYQDSIFIENKENNISELKVKYETEVTEKKNIILEKDLAINKLNLIKQKRNRNFLIYTMVLVLVILGITYSSFRLKRKTANSLALKNEVIENQKEALEKSDKNKQRLLGILAHDLINPFNVILGYTKLLDEDYASFSKNERKQFISAINKYAKSSYNLTRNLLDWVKVQQNRLVVKKETLNCKNIIATAIEPYMILANKKNINVSTNISDNIFVEADKNMLKSVIGNLFVNAVKFTNKKGEIKFHLNKNKDNTVTIAIEDNGVGMSQQQLSNLFDITKVSSSQGTNNEKGLGLGLVFSKELMELQNGSLQMFSKKDVGSKAVLTV